MRFFTAATLFVVLTTCSSVSLAQICPTPTSGPLPVIFIGNSYTGGRSVGKGCPDGAGDNDVCRQNAVPGNVKEFFVDPPQEYPGTNDVAPGTYSETVRLVDTSSPYGAITNPYLGDVPGKVKLLADFLCSTPATGGPSMYYVQNTQSAMTTRSHAGEAGTNPQYGTLNLLADDITVHNIFDNDPTDVVVVQPQSTEYITGSLETRKSALQVLFDNTNKPFRKFILQQTWPRREETAGYTPICDAGGKTGMINAIDSRIADLQADNSISQFIVAPTGNAFAEFGKLACPGIFDGSNYDTAIAQSCTLWSGEASKLSLYDEDPGEEGTHQSEQIGAWLSAAVLAPIIQNAANSASLCYISASDLEAVMPPIDAADLGAYNNSGTLSIYDLISQAARRALEGEFGVVSQCEAIAMPSAVPSTSSVPSSEPTASGICSSNAVNANVRCSVDTDCTCTATRNLQQCADQPCGKNFPGCCQGYECIKVKGSGTCQPGETSSPTVNPSSSPSSFPSVSSLPSASPSDRPSLRPSVTPPVFCGCILPTTDRPSTTPSVMPSIIPTKPPITLAACSSFSKRGECQDNGCMCSNSKGKCGNCVAMN